MAHELDPLAPGEKLFNQRMLAKQCIPLDRAQKIWNELQTKGELQDSPAQTLEESLSRCNAHLAMAGLELVGLVFAHNSTAASSQDNDEENDDPQQQQQANNNRVKNKTHYIAMVHKYTPSHNDTAAAEEEGTPPSFSASKVAFVKTSLGGPVAVNHRRAILEHICAEEALSAPRSTLINLKNDLSDATSSTYSLQAAEATVDSMVRDLWLVPSNNNNSRRISMNTQLTFGPRAYMELSDLLTEQFGMDQEHLPQQLYYR